MNGTSDFHSTGRGLVQFEFAGLSPSRAVGARIRTDRGSNGDSPLSRRPPRSLSSGREIAASASVDARLQLLRLMRRFRSALLPPIPAPLTGTASGGFDMSTRAVTANKR